MRFVWVSQVGSIVSDLTCVGIVRFATALVLSLYMAQRYPVTADAFGGGALPGRALSDAVLAGWLQSARARGVGRVDTSGMTSDEATAATIALLTEQIHSSARDPYIKDVARTAVRKFRGGPTYKGAAPLSDPLALALSCWWWARHALTFEHHEGQIARLLNEPDQQQLIISPDVTVRMENRRGDCAVYTAVICALLEALGVQWEIVTVAVNPREPGVYSHVYPRAVLPIGRVALDAIPASKGPGWQVPSAHVSKLQVWDESGRAVADAASRWDGLHAYEPGRTPFGANVSALARGDERAARFGETVAAMARARNAERRGLGFDIPDSSTVINYTGDSGGFNWGNFIGSTVGKGLDIVGSIVAPTYQRAPDGSLTIRAPGAAGSALVGTAAGVGASLPSSWFLWGGATLLGVLLISSMSRGR